MAANPNPHSFGKRRVQQELLRLVSTTKNKYGTWRTPDIESMDGSGTTLAVATYRIVTVFDARTGHELWRVAFRNDNSGIMSVYVLPHLVLRSRFVEGAGMSEETDAYDSRSGKWLWNADGDVDLAHTAQGHVDLQQFYLGEVVDHPRWLHHQVIEERTGKVLKAYMTK